MQGKEGEGIVRSFGEKKTRVDRDLSRRCIHFSFHLF